MRIYFDSSALVKRAIRETESAVLIDTIHEWMREGSHNNAVAGIDESPINETVADIARRLGLTALRSLDAIHLATATLIGADLVCAYDRRLLDSAEELGFRTTSPGEVAVS